MNKHKPRCEESDHLLELEETARYCAHCGKTICSDCGVERKFRFHIETVCAGCISSMYTEVTRTKAMRLVKENEGTTDPGDGIS